MRVDGVSSHLAVSLADVALLRSFGLTNGRGGYVNSCGARSLKMLKSTTSHRHIPAASTEYVIYGERMNQMGSNTTEYRKHQCTQVGFVNIRQNMQHTQAVHCQREEMPSSHDQSSHERAYRSHLSSHDHIDNYHTHRAHTHTHTHTLICSTKRVPTIKKPVLKLVQKSYPQKTSTPLSVPVRKHTYFCFGRGAVIK